VIAIGQPLLPVAPLMGAGVKQVDKLAAIGGGIAWPLVARSRQPSGFNSFSRSFEGQIAKLGSEPDAQD